MREGVEADGDIWQTHYNLRAPGHGGGRQGQESDSKKTSKQEALRI